MPQEKIYKNWKAVTEADFVSLFIKTWFAYISTLRTMFPEAANRRGDGKYLNAYKDNYRTSGSKKLVVDDQIMASMEASFKGIFSMLPVMEKRQSATSFPTRSI